MSEIMGVIAGSAMRSSRETAEQLERIQQLRGSKDRAIEDNIAALDARLRVIEARLGIESPPERQEIDPVAALERMAGKENELEGKDDAEDA